MESSIQQVARAAGTTSRTLRHYDALGLLRPSRTDAGGRRWYDDDTLVRLQQILLLRDLGLPLEQIGRVLDAQVDEVSALREHLGRLQVVQERLRRQAAAVERTITAREEGAAVSLPEMFDGFDHTEHREEVQRRWGADADRTSDAWWRAMSPAERDAWKRAAADLAAGWRAAADDGADPAGDRAQELAVRQVAWVSAIPGTPGTGAEPSRDYLLGLADMYVADPRFAANYGGEPGARFVRSALRVWAGVRPGTA